MENFSSGSQIIKSHLTFQEKEKLYNAFKTIIEIFGDGSEGQTKTPIRMIKAYEEILTSNLNLDLTTFESNGYDQMIVEKGIKYYTLCEHHFLPFYGEVKIGYIPNGKLIGLSKLARVVEHFSKRLNTQEYFTKNIASFLNEKLKPKGVGVVVTGFHLCQAMRGVKKEGEMITSELIGAFQDLKVREEFLKL
jgi:GTP cyclohydrolase I